LYSNIIKESNGLNNKSFKRKEKKEVGHPGTSEVGFVVELTPRFVVAQRHGFDAGCLVPFGRKKRKEENLTIGQSGDACRTRKLCAIKVSPCQQHVDFFFRSLLGNDALTSMRANIAIKFPEIPNISLKVNRIQAYLLLFFQESLRYLLGMIV